MNYYRGIFNELKDDNFLNIEEVKFYEGEFSEFYDNITKSSSYDIEYYISQACVVGNNILELACGTGRVGIPLAKKGFNVTGIDISKDMLSLYKSKIAREAKRIRNRIKLIEADITNIVLEEKYDLIILPVVTICLFEKELIKKIFSFVKNHLKPNGRFIFDWIDVDYSKFNDDMGKLMISRWGNNEKYNVVMFQEFLFRELDEVIVNVYKETIINDITKRTIGYTRKHIITKELIMECIQDSGLKISDKVNNNEMSNGINFMVLVGDE